MKQSVDWNKLMQQEKVAYKGLILWDSRSCEILSKSDDS